MDQSPTIGAIAAAIAKAQGAIPNVRKSHTAKIQTKAGGAYSYKYADLADVWDAVRSVLAANGLAVIQSPESMSEGLAIVTTIAHESGEWISGLITMPLADRTPQSLGTAITYLRRYGLCAMLGIVSDEDGDAQDRQESAQSAQPYQQPRQAPPAPQRPAQKATGSKAEAPRAVLVARLRELWAEERRLGGNTPAADLVWDIDNEEDASIEQIKALGMDVKARIEKLNKPVEDLL